MILKKAVAVFLVASAPSTQNLATPATAQRIASAPVDGTTDAKLASLFTPARPVLGRYEVLITPRPIPELTSAPVESLEAIDAFGMGGPYDRAALVRLYRGQRVQVSRSWTVRTGSEVAFESVTLISPYPDPSFRQLVAGTLIIRWTCEKECRSAESWR